MHKYDDDRSILLPMDCIEQQRIGSYKTLDHAHYLCPLCDTLCITLCLSYFVQYSFVSADLCGQVDDRHYVFNEDLFFSA